MISTKIQQAKELVKQGVPLQEAVKNVRSTFTPSSVPDLPAPVGVATTGPKVTPELQKTMTTTRLGGQPNIQPTAQEISAKSENTANQQQKEADQLMGLSKNIDKDLGVTPPTPTMEQATTQTNLQTGEIKQVAPIVEKTTVQTPEGTTTTTKEAPQQPTGITKDTQWQDVPNKDINSLEQLIEARYGTMATQKDGKLTANIGGKVMEWSLDAQGNPVKTENTVASGILTKYVSASSDQIYTGLVNGDIPPEFENQLVSNPNYAIAKEKQRKKISADRTNSMVQNIYSKTATEGNITQDMSDKITTRETAKGKSIEEIQDYASFMAEDKELTSMVTDMNAKQKQLNEINATIKGRADELMKQYPGMTLGAAILKSTRDNKDLVEYSDSLANEIGNLQANVNYREKINDKAYQELSDLRKLDRQEQIQIAQEERQFDRTLEMQKQQQLLTSGDLNSTDPFIQNRGIENAVNQLYTQYPIPGMKSPALKIQKVKDLIAQGMNPQQAIQQLEQEIRGSQRYKDYLASEKAKISPSAKFTEFGGNLYKTDEQGNLSLAISGPKKFTKLDDGTYQDEQGNIVTAGEIQQQKLLDNKFLTAPIGTNVGVECGAFARSCAGLSSTPGGNSLTERIKKFSDTSPVPGGLVLFNGGGYDKTYGHVAIVTGINQDGTIKIRESNLNGDNKVTERTIPLEGSSISGFYNNTPLAGGGDEGVKLSGEQQRITANQEKSAFRSNPEVKAFESALSANRNLVLSLEKGTAPADVAAVYQFMKSLDPNSVVRETEFAIAASATGLGDRATSIYDKVIKGEKLTDSQRKEFGNLAKAYIGAMGQTYDRLYNDMERTFEYFGLPSEILPTRATSEFKLSTGGQTTQTAPVSGVKEIKSKYLNY